jgi:oxidase EvaA
MINRKIINWLNIQKKKNKIQVKIKSLSTLKKWNYNDKEIYHDSKNFFKIVGIKIKTNFFKNNWEQPIIIQKDVGILGIIKNKTNNKYLLQAKVEPGNVNKLQLSPTVQATKSNYKGVHGGKKVPYLNYFLDKKRVNYSNQFEQGFRFLYKYNTNILISLKKKITLKPGFFWFSSLEIETLIKKKNILNMDTLSVFSSFIKKTKVDNPINSANKLNNLIKNNDKKYYVRSQIVNFTKIKSWTFLKEKIIHKKNKHFSIIGVSAKTTHREISEWDQPLLKSLHTGLNGFIVKNFNNTNHYLCRYMIKPGLKKSVISCTVNTHDYKNYNKDKNLSNDQRLLITNFFNNKRFRKKNTLFNNIISDEGGRFYRCEVRNIAVKLDEDLNINLPDTYFWVSQNQMINNIKKKLIDIEGRLLFACLNIKSLV